MSNICFDVARSDLTHKQNRKEPSALTTEEKIKLKRTEEAAQRFIDRWHETLDLNILFDEMYVSSLEIRRRNARLFYGVYKFITGSPYNPGVRKGVDEALMRAGFMAFWNMLYMAQEYNLGFDESASLLTPPEIEKAMEGLNRVSLNEKYIIRAEVIKYIEIAKQVSTLYRKHLTRGMFNSNLYKANLKKCKENDYEFRIERGFEEFGIRKEVEVYFLKSCLFEFYFVKEGSQLKVLTLGFEL
jgi:hypothetical protein